MGRNRIEINLKELEKFYSSHSYSETMQHFGISAGVLDRRLKECNLSHKSKGVSVPEEDIRQYYLVENHSKLETKDHFNLTDWTLSQLFKKYGIRKEKDSVVSIRKETKKIRYKDPNYNNRSKYKKTCQDLYGGIGFASEEWKGRCEKTIRSRYGEENIRRTQYFKDRAAKTKQDRYGDPKYNNMRLRKDTCLQKYGVDNPQKLQEVQQKVSFTVQEKYGVNWSCMRPEARIYSNNSKPNQNFAQFLEKNGIEFEREFPIGSKSYDFRVGNTLIELNPSATHNSTWGIKGSFGKDPKYHMEKSKLAVENGYECIHVWDWDDPVKVLHLLNLEKERIYARKCKLKEVGIEEANTFLEQYHFQGKCRGQKVGIGLYYEDSLVELMTFGAPRYNRKFQYELLRLCTSEKYLVVGGAERIWKYFIDTCAPESVISYCDLSKFSGKVYAKLGFTLRSSGSPSRHWYDGKIHITDNFLRQRGFDQLLGETYGRYGKGTSNDQLMREHGFVEIWDAGQAAYVWKA